MAVTERKTLTDRQIKALAPAPKGARYEVMDVVVPGLGVRVTDTGKRTFILIARFPGSKNPTRRALGAYGALTLDQARERAREWIQMLQKGCDPGVIAERAKVEAEQKRANTFEVVAEDWFVEKVAAERKGDEVKREFRREFVVRWAKRPITEITDLDVLTVIREKKATAPAQARNLLGYAKRFFAWVIDQRVYGLTSNPAESLKATKIIGKKRFGKRILNDDEIFALWRASGRIPYPHGPVYRLLLLTALRLNEAADASRIEIDRREGIWLIPSERMKGADEDARAHAVPLTTEILAILEGVPRFNRGTYLFSTTFGEKPVWMSDKVKKRLDARMLRTLRALARRRGEDPVAVTLPRWTNHDIRRTVRSQLSRLKVTEEAREAVLAHVRPGIKGVYDHHDYLDEKREALELWAARLRAIVSPRSDNVVHLARAGR